MEPQPIENMDTDKDTDKNTKEQTPPPKIKNTATIKTHQHLYHQR